MSKLITPAHDQSVINHYVIHFPDHAPREEDPHYHAFNAFRSANIDDAFCYVGRRVGYGECADAQGYPMLQQPIPQGHGLELHHHFLEFSLINECSLEAIQVDYPNLLDAEAVAEWAETDPNFMWLCAKHHRGVGGVHHAAAADFAAAAYIKGLISK